MPVKCFIFIFDDAGKGHSPNLGLQELVPLLYLCITSVDFFVVYTSALVPPRPRVIINLYYEKECK